MPVEGLTNKPHRIPRLGKIRLGDRSGTNGAPVNRPFFVVPPEVQEVYGSQPTELKIVFLGENEESIASTYYRSYNTTSGLICKGTGVAADALLDGDVIKQHGGGVEQPLPLDAWAHGATSGRKQATSNFVRHTISCPGAGRVPADGRGAVAPCPMFAAKKCAVRGFFQFAVVGVKGAGVYQMDTGSVANIDAIFGTLELAKALTGGVAGVPMTLSRVQKEMAPDGKKKKVWVVELLIDTSLSLTEVLHLRRGPIAQTLLPPVDETEPYEAIADEDEAEVHGAAMARPEPLPPATRSALVRAVAKLNGLAEPVKAAKYIYLRDNFPGAFKDNLNDLNALSADEAGAVLRFLSDSGGKGGADAGQAVEASAPLGNDAQGMADAPAPQSLVDEPCAKGGEHDVYADDAAVMCCRKCERVLEGPDTGQTRKLQPAMLM